MVLGDLITEGGGPVVGESRYYRERNRIYDLKANILKIKGAISGTFLAFAEILSAMAAY